MSEAADDPGRRLARSTPQSWTVSLREVLGKGAVQLAVGTAILYVAGSLYIDAYYSSFGIPEGTVERSVASAMRQSFFPLLYPIFWLTLVSVATLLIAQRRREKTRGPFHPIPAIEAVTVVLVLWTMKLLADFFAPSGSVLWLWSVRDVGFVVIGAIVLGWRFWRNDSNLRKVGRLHNNWVGRAAELYIFTGVLIIWHVASGRGWPLGVFLTILLIGGIMLTIGSSLWSLRGRNQQKPNPSGTTPVSTGPDPPRTGTVVFLCLVVAMMFLLSASLAGTLAGRETLNGCRAVETISFDPTPHSLDANVTYWLVLQTNQLYYVREVPPAGNNTYIVPKDPGMTIILEGRVGSSC